jgi:hypothetical protein
MMKQKKSTVNSLLFGIFIVLGILTISQTVMADNNKYNEFYVVDYGAIADGTTINSKSIQSAIDACSDAGGGKVIFTPGKYLSGTIIMKDNVELNLQKNATLLASTNHEDFPLQPLPKYRSHKDQLGGFYALIYAEGAENISLTGNGTIDGQGKQQKSRENPVAGDIDGRPRNILLISCKNIRVEGIHMRNSGVWNQHYLNCEDLMINNISVYNHSNRNNDGIDIDGCRRVVVANSIFDSDDDGLTLKSTGPAACEDIVITNCVVSSFCNAIKAGTESSGGFKNISISNCVVKPSISPEEPFFHTPRVGITGLSLMIVDGGTMEGITVNNLSIRGTMTPIYIRLGNRARRYTAGIDSPMVGKVRNISINNVVAYDAGSWGVSITGLSGNPVQNISLSNIQLFTKGGVKKGEFNDTVSEDEKGYPQPTVWKNLPAFGFFIRHAEGVSITNFTIGLQAPDVRVPIIAEDVTGLRLEGCRLDNAIDSKPFVIAKGIEDYLIKKPLGWSGKGTDLIKRVSK